MDDNRKFVWTSSILLAVATLNLYAAFINQNLIGTHLVNDCTIGGVLAAYLPSFLRQRHAGVPRRTPTRWFEWPTLIVIALAGLIALKHMIGMGHLTALVGAAMVLIVGWTALQHVHDG